MCCVNIKAGAEGFKGGNIDLIKKQTKNSSVISVFIIMDFYIIFLNSASSEQWLMQ